MISRGVKGFLDQNLHPEPIIQVSERFSRQVTHIEKIDETFKSKHFSLTSRWSGPEMRGELFMSGESPGRSARGR